MTLFTGIPCYVCFGTNFVDTTRPSLARIDPADRLRILPFDSTPPYFVAAGELPTVPYPEFDVVEIPPSPLRYARAETTLAVLRSGEGTFRVTDGGATTVTFDNGESRPLPDKLRDVRLKLGTNLGQRTFALTAKRDRETYLFVAAEEDGKWIPRVDASCVRAEQRNGATLILESASASGLIGNVTVYNSAFLPTETYSVYTGSPLTEDPVSIAYDLLKLNLDEEASACFAESLLAETPIGEIKTFFSEYVSLSPAVAANDMYALRRADGKIELYRATIENGKISDLEEARHPLATQSSSD